MLNLSQSNIIGVLHKSCGLAPQDRIDRIGFIKSFNFVNQRFPLVMRLSIAITENVLNWKKTYFSSWSYEGLSDSILPAETPCLRSVPKLLIIGLPPFMLYTNDHAVALGNPTFVLTGDVT